MIVDLPVRAGDTCSSGVVGARDRRHSSVVTELADVRYEILPFGSIQREAEIVGRPLTLTVTCSPKQGIDHSVDVGCSLQALGHTVIVHLAARMVRGPRHLDELLSRMASAGIADVFLVGGDAAQPHGPYASAAELLPVLRAHRHAPRSIGVAAYPEGHPLIADDVLLDALVAKDGLADYMVTQMCFDAGVVLRWLQQVREVGIGLPLYVGLPGDVDRRKLLEVSLRVGVGRSIGFMRKQQGVTRLLRPRTDATDDLYAALTARVGRELGIAGLHVFTFNRLADSLQRVERQAATALSAGSGARA